MKKKCALAASVLLTLASVGCSSSETTADSSNTSSVIATSSSSEKAAPSKLKAGDSFDVPCSSTDETTCMTVEVLEIKRIDTCSEFESSPEEDVIALNLKASMDEGAPEDFTSPFRSFPWKYSTPDKSIARVDTETMCNGDSSYLNLMDEFPGYSAEGTAYLKVSNDADVIHFENPDESVVMFDLSAAADSSAQDDETATAEANSPEAPVPAPEPAPAPAPAATFTTTEIVEQAPPVVGYTEAPGIAEPTVMDKVVLRCGTAAENMEPGTTFFTDGTSGWTAACDTQMRAEYAQLGY